MAWRQTRTIIDSPAMSAERLVRQARRGKPRGNEDDRIIIGYVFCLHIPRFMRRFAAMTLRGGR